MSAIICGGPEPRTQKACYGGCYEWCIASGWCSTAEGDLTDEQRSVIRRFQRRAGGIFPNDLRTVRDFGLTPAMADAMLSGAYMAAPSRNRTCAALERRGLIGWWGDDLDDMHNKDRPGHWHLMGEGADFITKATGNEPDLCPCVTNRRAAS